MSRGKDKLKNLAASHEECSAVRQNPRGMRSLSRFKYFENKECEFYPCHVEGQNCLFCYCPLYWIPIDCGGKYDVLKDGIIDCSNCTKPHESDGWEFVQNKLREAFNWIAHNRE